MPETPLVSVAGLSAQYGDIRAVDGVSFHVNAGEVVALIGHNGAGKTTTLKSVMGLMRSREGSVKVRGVETIALPCYRIARLGVAYCPEERAIFSNLSAGENLLLPPVLKQGGMPTDEIFRLFPNLGRRLSTMGTLLSGGEQQMLAMARILRTGADIILLDEITEGLAPVIVQEMGAALRTLKARGTTILLVEQNLGFARSIADRFYMLESGRVAAACSNTPDDLKQLERSLQL